ncbi:MAG TPA: HNH endonuclease [Candidatus Hydrogenedentes bacterium]|nr:HNH endonuclease [Candidatus Hydrogenedentota bacterium]HNT86954.1 HNH endonuclease [Candidatus Hydrogenedentota bacterium]
MATKQSSPKNYGALWTRDELILAFELYCRIPFKKTKANNPEVITLAKLIDRSPAGVARKLGNFGAFDPELQKRGVSGLVHASKMDAHIWNEFNNDWNNLVLEASRLREALSGSSERDEVSPAEFPIPTGPSERASVRKTRIHQAFFRDAILSSYDRTCCITGLRVCDVLVASHIVPWSVSEHFRTDPRNGLCLSATFDRLFDRGLLTISSDFNVVVSQSLRSCSDKQIEDLICVYHGAPMIRPHRFLPDQAHLEWHRSNLFHD